ncbi:MAG: orotate phosphoribosyltransferase [Actinomycetota bacterium]
MSEQEVRTILENNGAILHGHFKLSSGLHSATYVQCARVLEHPRIAHELGSALASKLKLRYGAIDTIASPALGALLIGYATAYALDVRFIFSERVDGTMTFRRGQQVREGERIVVIEDAVTTGGSIKEVLSLIDASNGVALGAGTIVDRTGSPAPFALESLTKVDAVAFGPDECPQCKSGTAITAPGSRHRAD